MEEWSTYCGASSKHIICQNYKFESNESLNIFRKDEVFEKFKWLDIIKCSGDLALTAFKNIPRLEILNIINSTIDSIDENTFSTLNFLKSLDVRKSIFPVNSAVFKKCDNLESLRLILVENQINLERLFEGLIKLDYLFLYKLPKFQIGCESFLGLGNLKYLFIQNCTIENVNVDAFTPLKSLESFYFTKNTISNFSQNSLSTLKDTLKNLAIIGNTSESLNNLEIDYQQFENFSALETICFPDIELKKLNFVRFHTLKTVQIIIDENQDDLFDFLTGKGINVEWTTYFDLPEENDGNKPNIQICA